MSTESNSERGVVQEQQEEEVRLAAYYLWEEKGRRDGSDIEDWIEAEEVVND
jgi:hypothetical protein